MGETEEQRFLFQALPCEESYTAAHIIFRDTDCLALQTQRSERYIIKICIIKINFFNEGFLFFLFMFLINKNAVMNWEGKKPCYV